MLEALIPKTNAELSRFVIVVSLTHWSVAYIALALSLISRFRDNKVGMLVDKFVSDGLNTHEILMRSWHAAVFCGSLLVLLASLSDILMRLLEQQTMFVAFITTVRLVMSIGTIFHWK